MGEEGVEASNQSMHNIQANSQPSPHKLAKTFFFIKYYNINDKCGWLQLYLLIACKKSVLNDP